MRGKPPTHLVLEVLKALAAQHLDSRGERWTTAECLIGACSAGRSAASIANSCAAGYRHSWVDRKPVGKCVYWQITGAGLAEVRLATGAACNHGSDLECPVHGWACPDLAKVRLASGQGQDDTLAGTGHTAGVTAPDTAPAGRSPGGADWTSADPRAAGATSPRGAQPPGPGREPECDCDASMISGGMASAHLNWCATLRPSRPPWVDHDGLCQHRRSMGVMACDCTPSCNCRACRHDRLAWALVEIARRFPDGLDRLTAAVAA